MPEALLKNRSRWWRFFAGSDPERSIGELLAHAGSKMDLHERSVWFESVLHALSPRDGESPEVRLRYFLNLLEKNPGLAATFRASVQTLFHECSFLRFFSQTGYTHEHGLWSEVTGRLFKSILPQDEMNDFEDIVARAFENEEARAWLGSLSTTSLAQFFRLFHEGQPESDGTPSFGIADDLRDATLLLGINIAHHGLSIAVRGRLRKRREIADSSFLRLSAKIQARERIEPELITRCRADIEAVYRDLETSGVSVGTVHTLESLTAAIDRLEVLLSFRERMTEEAAIARGVRLIVEVARSAERGRSVRGHLGRHFYLLARKVAERNGQSGEHYIARTSHEYRVLFRSAFWGGIIVVLMTIAKIGVLHLPLPPIFLAVAVSLVYVAGFLAMQFFDATLATKIPSFAASRLAQWIKEARSKKDTKAFTREVSSVVKSQALGLFANVLAVIPFAWVIDFVVRKVFGSPLLGEHYSQHTLSDLHPLYGPALFHGALTGAELWTSSLIGGWFENFVVFRRLPITIARHPRLRKIFGDARAKSFSEAVLRNASGIGANVSLGFLFGFVPLAGTLLGMNLDGKHVTISTASATFSVASLGASTPGSALGWTAAGLFIVGAMNFVVSFSLALIVAVRAQDVRRGWALHFIRSLWRRPA